MQLSGVSRRAEQASFRPAKKPAAVYVTSPDYLGNILDIRGLAEVCRAHSLPLLVDNAHGAYLQFLEPSLHPIALGPPCAAIPPTKRCPS